MSLTVTVVNPASGETAQITVPDPVVQVVSATAVYENVDNPPQQPVLAGTQTGSVAVRDAAGNLLTPANWPYGVVALGNNQFKTVPGGWSGYAVVTAATIPAGGPTTYDMMMTTDP